MTPKPSAHIESGAFRVSGEQPSGVWPFTGLQAQPHQEEPDMKTGTFRALTGELVAVTRTESGGYVLRYPDGRVALVGGKQ